MTNQTRSRAGGLISAGPLFCLLGFCLLGFWLLAAVLTGGPAWSAESCDEAIAAILAEHGLDIDKVPSIYSSPRIQSGKPGSTGLDVWIRLKGCHGALVLDLDPDCRLGRLYTHGDCKVEGVDAY